MKSSTAKLIERFERECARWGVDVEWSTPWLPSGDDAPASPGRVMCPMSMATCRDEWFDSPTIPAALVRRLGDDGVTIVADETIRGRGRQHDDLDAYYPAKSIGYITCGLVHELSHATVWLAIGVRPSNHEENDILALDKVSTKIVGGCWTDWMKSFRPYVEDATYCGELRATPWPRLATWRRRDLLRDSRSWLHSNGLLTRAGDPTYSTGGGCQ